jgi:hypothetical protein
MWMLVGTRWNRLVMVCERKKWGGVPSFIKEHQSVNISLKTFFFVWKIVRTPLPVVDKDNHLSKPIFYLSVLQMKSSSTCLTNILMPRVNLIVILMTYCPTVICLPNMLLFILWRDTTSELWTSIQFPLHCYYRLIFYLLILLSCILLSFTTWYAQSFVYSKPVRLTTSS